MFEKLVNASIKLSVNFHAVNRALFTYVESWLTDGLDIKEYEPLLPICSADTIEQTVREFIHYQHYVSRLLFQLGNVPVFNLPKTISVVLKDEEKQLYQVEIEVQNVEAFPDVIYPLVINSSLGLCRWMSENPIYSVDRNKFYLTIQEKVIRPLQHLIPSGKSTIPVLRTAHLLGIPIIHLGQNVYQFGWGSRSRRMDRSITGQDSAIGSKLAQNKVATAHILHMAGLPAPTHTLVTCESDALSAAIAIGYPVVIKPTDQERGIGVTVDIFNDAAVKIAFSSAQQLSRSKKVIVERQVPGICHRIFIANGKMLYTVKRLPISVIGDGNQTIKQLVDSEVTVQNRLPPWRRSEIKPIDELAKKVISKAGFTLNSVPKAGVIVPLRRIESTEWGGIDEEVSSLVHHENINLAIHTAGLFGLNVAGIDIITEDISTPWYENGAIINEINFSPLFGGGDISRRKIPIFFQDFIQGNGKIPIEIFNTSQFKQAKIRQIELVENGSSCYLTTETETINPNGTSMNLITKGLKDRIRALLVNPDVDTIVVVSSFIPDQE